MRGGAAEVHAPASHPRPPAWTLTRGGAAAGVVLVQVVLQRVPAASHTHHHVAPQHLWEPGVRRSRAGQPPPRLCLLGEPPALTRTKMSRLESPTRYFPSETLIMGNWSGQVQRPKISLT